MTEDTRALAQDERAQPVAWRVHYCGQWLYFENEAACEIYCHSNNKAEPLYQSQAKEPEASGGLCTAAPHAVRVGEASADLPATSESMDVTAGETAPSSEPTSGVWLDGYKHGWDDHKAAVRTPADSAEVWAAHAEKEESCRKIWQERAERAEALVEKLTGDVRAYEITLKRIAEIDSQTHSSTVRAPE